MVQTSQSLNISSNCDVLRDLVSFAQSKKPEKKLWRSVTFSKVAGNFNKSNTPPWVFFMLFKLYKWCQVVQRIANDHPGKTFQQAPSFY